MHEKEEGFLADKEALFFGEFCLVKSDGNTVRCMEALQSVHVKLLSSLSLCLRLQHLRDQQRCFRFPQSADMTVTCHTFPEVHGDLQYIQNPKR